MKSHFPMAKYILTEELYHEKKCTLKLTSPLAVAAMQPIMSPTGFGIAELSDDDPSSWGDPVED